MKPEYFSPPLNDIALMSIWEFILNNYSIKDVEYLYYIGAIGGSELETYNSKKLYIAKYLHVSYSTTNPQAAPSPTFVFYDVNNIFTIIPYNVAIYWDTTALVPKNILNSMVFENLLLSRIGGNAFYTYIFAGLKVTLN